ncbi:MAG: hypothetical protein PHR25_05530 [Clostridia bacterium]|nr:hypothetical protein [Clostridia bacterium]
MNNNFYEDLESTKNKEEKEYLKEVEKRKNSSIKEEKNIISNILKIIGWCILIIGFILGFVNGKDEYDELSLVSMIIVWCTYGLYSTGSFALAEIIQILHDIRMKIWKA